MLNKVILQGRFVADPELKHTASGVDVVSFRLAVDRNFKDKETGERKADFLNVVAWRKTAELVSRYFAKGNMAVVEGSLQTRDYTDKEGVRRFVTEVLADNVYFCDSRKSGDGSRREESDPYAAAGHAYYAEQAGRVTDVDVDDGKLPF